MYIDYKLEGKYVTLRSVEETDAEFILSVRNNPRISEYLPPLSVTVEQQQQWIAKQRADKDSYYFLMETLDGQPIGTIGLYDIIDNHAEAGRYCCIGEPTSAAEACILMIDFSFNKLHLDYKTTWVYDGNKTVIAMNKSFGYEWVEKKVDDKGEPFSVGVLTRDRAIERLEKIKKRMHLTY